MNLAEQKRAAAAFVDKWSGRGYEKGDTHSFWMDFLRDVMGMPDVSNKCRFEVHTRDGGFIDALLPDFGTIIEQKGIGVNLDKSELRQSRQVTPYQQVYAYAVSFPLNRQPRFIIVCNFEAFRIYDRDKENPEAEYEEVKLADLERDCYLFNFITDPANSRLEREKQVSIGAGELIGQLHRALMDRYINPESPESQHALNVLCVRLVFCLYAEDSGLFGKKDLLLDYLRNVRAEDVRVKLIDLFKVLDTKEDERDPYLSDDLKAFPYVNGGLFKGEVEIPNFTESIRFLLLLRVSQETDWSAISPTIFGGVFESTLNPETRRSGGMHYTSIENIHKVIDSLFLNDLNEEFNDIVTGDLAERTKRQRLMAFREKIGSLNFFDPACGSGNFLTETYICLRRLENDVLMELRGGQGSLGFEGLSDVKVSLDQFYGIEINDFAVRVAKTALWIAELQANQESESIILRDIEDLPLQDSANVVLANALCLDWSDLLPAGECDFIMGNPPFIGYASLTDRQKLDRAGIFGKTGNILDYVACWYKKAAGYTSQQHIRCAFVSTNSICQGQQVEPLWKPLFEDGINIDFAYRTFVCNNEAADQAHVHVVIVGFSREDVSNKRLVDGGSSRSVNHINAYLTTAPDAFVVRRAKPLCNVMEMVAGGKPSDGGNLILNQEERDELVRCEPRAERWIRPFSMGAEFIRGIPRYCLWLVDCDPRDIKAMPRVAQRVEAVRQMRLSSSKAATRMKAETPWIFDELRPPRGESYIAVPKVSSGRRRYIPLGFVSDNMIPGDELFYISDAGLYEFGILSSQFHNAWIRVISGRLKSDYRYSNTVVYNNFMWPEITEAQRASIVRCAQSVLDARAQRPSSSLADLYDPDYMPMDLRTSHKSLDRAVEQAYGVIFNGNEEKIVAHLFRLYAEKVLGG